MDKTHLPSTDLNEEIKASQNGNKTEFEINQTRLNKN
jgi:hypothetical protein